MSTAHYQNILADKIVQVFHENDIVLFGSYVREYSSGREHDFNKSDIDCFSNTLGINQIINLLDENGIRTISNVLKSNYYVKSGINTFGLEVCSKNIDIKTSIKLDVCTSKDRGVVPPFGNLDFECNALIWDKSGVKLSTNTGTYLDNLSPEQRESKKTDIIIRNIVKFTTINKLPSDGTSRGMINKRKKLLLREIKMIKNGWEITNSKISICRPEGGECGICDKMLNSHKAIALKGDCKKLYHIKCFRETSINCPKCESCI
jgi:hypothetical protein